MKVQWQPQLSRWSRSFGRGIVVSKALRVCLVEIGRSPIRHVFGLLFLLLVASRYADGADIQLLPHVQERLGLEKRQAKWPEDFPHLRISGAIVESDLQKIKRLLPKVRAAKDQLDIRVPVIVDSHGGDVLTAISIGSFLRESKAWVDVATGGSCDSACVFILAGGVRRTMRVEDTIGLHRPIFNPRQFASLSASEAESAYLALIERCRRYFDRMGQDPRLFADMLQVPSQEVRAVDWSYAEQVRLIGDDPAFTEWLRASQLERFGVEYVRQADAWLACLSSGKSHQECDPLFPKRYEKTRSLPPFDLGLPTVPGP
jgi:hypothetical protein